MQGAQSSRPTVQTRVTAPTVPNDEELLFHRSTHARGLLQAVEAALSRISEGTFGNCLRCGEEINTKRLEAVPSTRYYLTCQELLEGKD